LPKISKYSAINFYIVGYLHPSESLAEDSGETVCVKV